MSVSRHRASVRSPGGSLPVLLAAATVAACASGGPPPPGRVAELAERFGGDWVLAPTESDTYADAVQRRRQDARPGVRPGGVRFVEGAGGPDDPRRIAERFTLELARDAVGFFPEDAEATRVPLDDVERAVALGGDATITVRGRWDGESFEVRYDADDGSDVVDRYSVSRAGDRLTVVRHVETSPGPWLEIVRVYHRPRDDGRDR